MHFRLSRHAEWEMTRRGIAPELVRAVIDHPEQRQVDESRPDRWIHQSRLRFEDGKNICCESWWMKMRSRL
jgi:hypothetical protein